MPGIAPNPFLEATFGELCQAISQAVRFLEDRQVRSHAEREAFAERLRHLLLACGVRFMASGDTVPGSPEMPLRRDPRALVSEVFLPWYRLKVAQETSTVRRYTLWRAANVVLGRDAYRFLEPPDVLWDRRPGYLGACDDERLAAVLRELDAIRATVTPI